jgi:hypothetical protein
MIEKDEIQAIEPVKAPPDLLKSLQEELDWRNSMLGIAEDLLGKKKKND